MIFLLTNGLVTRILGLLASILEDLETSPVFNTLGRCVTRTGITHNWLSVFSSVAVAQGQTQRSWKICLGWFDLKCILRNNDRIHWWDVGEVPRRERQTLVGVHRTAGAERQAVIKDAEIDYCSEIFTPCSHLHE